LFVRAYPIEEKLIEDIENNPNFPLDGNKELKKYLVENYNYDEITAQKIWSFGPDECGPNMFVDLTKGVQCIMDIKSHVITGFMLATSKGVLCEEPMRGIRFELQEAAASWLMTGIGNI
jgi:elongation factor 2